MIEIKGLEKWYKTRSGKKHQALKDINLEIGSKGFVVILGKSGSGKSTLLNILGGLDKFDSGEITIKGKSTLDFKNNQWDSYRNSYVGFIFQNFSVMDNISVSDNVALPLKLQDYNSEEISELVDEVLDRVDLKEYKDRKPNELSGGQKQRVAIARALVKDPEIILADEPTGNLDSKTGKAILELLKTFSKDKLVIMVTHDESFAYRYGDRIIELKDGEIINDTINENDDNNYLENRDISTELNFKKLSLNFNNAFKLAVSSIFTKKIKFFFMLILFTAALIFVGIGTNFSNYDSDKVAIKTFENAGINRVFLEKRILGFRLDKKIYEPSTIKKISDDDLYYFRNNYQSIDFSEVRGKVYPMYDEFSNYSYPVKNPYYENYVYIKKIPNMVIFESKESVLEYGYEIIIGNNITNNNDLLITDYIAESLVYHQVYGDIKMDELIGKEITIEEYKFNIAGIVDTDSEKYQDFIELHNGMWDKDTTDAFQYDVYNRYLTIFTTRENLELMEENINFTNAEIIIDSSFNDKSIEGLERELYLSKSSYYSLDDNLLLGDSKLPENNREVVLSVSTVIDIINEENNTEITYDDFMNELDDYLSSIIDSSIILKYVKPHWGIQYTIVGVYDDNETQHGEMIIIDDDYFLECYYDRIENRRILALFNEYNSEGVKLLNEFDTLGLPSYVFLHNTEYSDLIYEIETFTTSTKTIYFAMAGVFSVFASVMIFIFISSSINDKKKEIGILRALGARGIDIAKIFVVEGLIITITAVILASILMSIIIRVINNEIASNFSTDLVLLYNDFLSVLVVIAGGLFVTLLSSLIPIRRITVMKPIDAIKNK